MPTGAVARFDVRRGYGFVIPDDGGEDVFVHQNNIVMDGFRFLKEGERVHYELEVGEKGMKAVQVSLLQPRSPEDERPERPERSPHAERSHHHDNRSPRRGHQGRDRDRDRDRDRGSRRGGDDRVGGDLQRLRRKFERLVSLLVAKDILEPGELDRLPAGVSADLRIGTAPPSSGMPSASASQDADEPAYDSHVRNHDDGDDEDDGAEDFADEELKASDTE